MKTIEKQIWDLLDQARGAMELSHVLELLAHIALVAKHNPEGFEALANTGAANQYFVLAELGQELQSRTKLAPAICGAPEKSRIVTVFLTQSIQLIKAYIGGENANFSLLARAIRNLCAQTGKFAGEFASNLSLERLFKELVTPCEGKTLYDGASGLAQVASCLNVNKRYLEERNQSTYIVAQRLLLLENKSVEAYCSNALVASSCPDIKADLVVMEPPMGLKFSADQRRELANEDYLVIESGSSVPASAGDALWLQRALSRLNEQGKAYILLPQGWLFRGGYDASMREYLLENELLEAIIALPPQILNFTGIAPAIVVLNKAKPAGTPVHFVDASEVGEIQQNMRVLSEQDAAHIAQLASGELPGHKQFKAAFLPEIRENDSHLSINRYIKKEVHIKRADIKQESMKFAQAQKHFFQSQQQLKQLLAEVSPSIAEQLK